jgi:hypothetical protein
MTTSWPICRRVQALEEVLSTKSSRFVVCVVVRALRLFVPKGRGMVLSGGWGGGAGSPPSFGGVVSGIGSCMREVG